MAGLPAVGGSPQSSLPDAPHFGKVLNRRVSSCRNCPRGARSVTCGRCSRRRYSKCDIFRERLKTRVGVSRDDEGAQVGKGRQVRQRQPARDALAHARPGGPRWPGRSMPATAFSYWWAPRGPAGWRKVALRRSGVRLPAGSPLGSEVLRDAYQADLVAVMCPSPQPRSGGPPERRPSTTTIGRTDQPLGQDSQLAARPTVVGVSRE